MNIHHLQVGENKQDNFKRKQKNPRPRPETSAEHPNFTYRPQWLYLVPLKGGIGSIVHPPIGRKNATYIYHL